MILSPERSYALEQRPGGLQGPPVISRIQDLLLPGHTCALSWPAPVPIQAPPEHPTGQHHIRRVRMKSRGVGLLVSPGLVPGPSELFVHGNKSSC